MSGQTTRRRIFGVAVVAIVAATVPAGTPVKAGEAQDSLFATGVLDAVPTGQRLTYTRRRGGSAAAGGTDLPPVEHGTVEIRLVAGDGTPARRAEVTLLEGQRQRAMPPFPAAGGNPLLLVFLESTVNAMAAATGGSPHYIRNRIKDALRSEEGAELIEVEVGGEAVAARRFSVRPFVRDEHVAEMGPFAALEIRFVLSAAVPGRLAVLEAIAGDDASGEPALHETTTFRSMETNG